MDSSFVRPRILSVEGNIGAGKSTLVEALKERYAHDPSILFLQEPVDVWSTVQQDGKTILELFYENQEKYSFAFQILAYSTRLELIEKAVQDATANGVKTIVMERSLEADKNIFAKMLYDEGKLEPCMHDIYLHMSRGGLEKYTADGILWVHAGPETCYERIAKRGREGEDQIPLSYLERCDVYHREWLGADTGFVHLVDDTVDWEALDVYLRGAT